MHAEYASTSWLWVAHNFSPKYNFCPLLPRLPPSQIHIHTSWLSYKGPEASNVEHVNYISLLFQEKYPGVMYVFDSAAVQNLDQMPTFSVTVPVVVCPLCFRSCNTLFKLVSSRTAEASVLLQCLRWTRHSTAAHSEPVFPVQCMCVWWKKTHLWRKNMLWVAVTRTKHEWI